MVAFMDTVATIPTGAMAERWKWGSFVIWGLFCGAIYYPLFAAWTWGGGWLAKTWDTMSLGVGYVDFAGSGVVHAVGGVAALAGALVLGPRIGKFDKDGTPRAMPGHHIPMAMLGTFILLFGWFGFNAASTFAATDVQFAVGRHQHGDRRCVRRHRRHAVDHQAHRQARPRHDGQRHARRPRGDHRPVCLHRTVGGGGDRLHRRRARHRGGVLRRAQAQGRRPGGRHLGPRRLRLRSACSPSASSPTAATATAGTEPSTRRKRSLEGIIKGEWGQLGAQALGRARDLTVIFGVAFAFFKLQDTISKSMGKGGIRSSEEDEIAGLDFPEMGVEAYPEFVKH